MENQPSYHCTNCGAQMLPEAEICTSCGVRQGKEIHFCYNCGNEIKPNQELCLNCGVNPRKVPHPSRNNRSESSGSNSINIVLATILGYILPGLPSILWYEQKKKGITLLIVGIVCGIIFPGVGYILFGVVTAIDAYQLGKRVNNGEALDEWTFFWEK